MTTDPSLSLVDQVHAPSIWSCVGDTGVQVCISIPDYHRCVGGGYLLNYIYTLECGFDQLKLLPFSWSPCIGCNKKFISFALVYTKKSFRSSLKLCNNLGMAWHYIMCDGLTTGWGENGPKDDLLRSKLSIVRDISVMKRQLSVYNLILTAQWFISIVWGWATITNQLSVLLLSG